MSQRIKTVFHVHTDYSDDSNASVRDVIDAARQSGVGCVAVTDHDTIEGAVALAAAAHSELQVIVGEEVSTAEGHLIGLFLREEIEPGLSARQTALRIREQGGLVVAPHPFNRIFGCSLRESVYRIMDLLDVIEVCNAQNLLPFPNRRAEAFARGHAFPSIVGSDTHHRGHLDSCYQLIEPFEEPRGFLASLRSATFVNGRHPIGYFLQAANVVLRSRLRLPIPDSYGRHCPMARPRMTPAVVPVRTK